MPKPDLFVHRRLRHDRTTRVLILLPSINPHAPCQCRLKEFDLNESENYPKYEAISYVWGSPTGTFPIKCDGKVLLVTENCLSALYQLRRRVRSRVLWIDSICIDQTDTPGAIDERSVQIRLMGEVYRFASRVIIWFGPDLAHSWIIFRLLEVVARLNQSPLPLFPSFLPKHFLSSETTFSYVMKLRSLQSWAASFLIGM